MKMTKSFSSLLGGAILLSFVQSAAAVPVPCVLTDATANGEFANACAGSNTNIANPSDATSFVNGSWGGTPESDFTFVDKTGDSSAVAGFVLTVNESTNSSGDYLFEYKLDVPQNYVGTVVDWVLGIKQSNNSYITYRFDNVTLGINGEFDSFWYNPNEKQVNDFSHAAGFIRVVSTEVPEPGTLALLGLGLTGLVIARRRQKA